MKKKPTRKSATSGKGKRSAGKSKPATAPRPSSAMLTEFVDTLVKEAGEDGVAQILGSDELRLKIRGVISTQCATVDDAIGRGGVPLGRLSIVHGAEGSGKTTLALHLVAECQRKGGIVLYFDTEHKLDPEYAARIGVETKTLIVSQPGTLEQAFKMIEAAVGLAQRYREQAGRRVPVLVILDSMNSTISRSQVQTDYSDSEQPGAQAAAFSRGLPKVMPRVSRSDIALVFISQVREKIGVLFGAKEKLAGGRSPLFYASLVLEVKRKAQIKEGDDILGNETEVYVRKNQIAPPFKRAEFQILYGKGIDKAGALLALAVQRGVVEKSGSWFALDGERIGHGKAKAADTVRKNADIRKRIKRALKKKGA